MYAAVRISSLPCPSLAHPTLAYPALPLRGPPYSILPCPDLLCSTLPYPALPVYHDVTAAPCRRALILLLAEAVDRCWHIYRVLSEGFWLDLTCPLTTSPPPKKIHTLKYYLAGRGKAAGTDRKGTMVDIASCGAACEAKKTCMGFMWSTDKKMCELKYMKGKPDAPGTFTALNALPSICVCAAVVVVVVVVCVCVSRSW